LLHEQPEFALKTADQAAEKAAPGAALRGEVEFRDVHFRYPSRPEVEVLKGISFAVKPGEKIALVGARGSGKWTIISLLLRFYDPDSGEILIDPCPECCFPLNGLDIPMSIVPLAAMLFFGSIFDNIAYRRPGS